MENGPKQVEKVDGVWDDNRTNLVMCMCVDVVCLLFGVVVIVSSSCEKLILAGELHLSLGIKVFLFVNDTGLLPQF